jgi:hypothetical protein
MFGRLLCRRGKKSVSAIVASSDGAEGSPGKIKGVSERATVAV